LEGSRREFLVVAPHIDDEVLGCGGVLDDRFHVHYCGVEEFRIVSREARLAEAKACAEFLGFSYSVDVENPVNAYSVSRLIGPFEELLRGRRPKTVFLPYPSYNQDHRAVVDAMLTALRPHDVNPFVRNVLLYEEIQVTSWPCREDLLRGTAAQPNCFAPIDIERKIAAYRLHASQVRAMRSPELLVALAKWRGFQGGYEYAEAFQAVRLSEPSALALGTLRGRG
jgi:LmbE family N-acetylglucosaminyl deacetylase